MAEVQQDQGKGRYSSSRKSTKVDMTAMVDVAFLLLTFFILTTSLATPKAMQLTKHLEGKSAPVACSKVMELYLGADNQVYVFSNCAYDQIHTVSFSEVRDVITRHLEETQDPIFSIKASDQARYKNLVDILDEMQIADAQKYALASLTDNDREFLQNKGLK